MNTKELDMDRCERLNELLEQGTNEDTIFFELKGYFPECAEKHPNDAKNFLVCAQKECKGDGLAENLQDSLSDSIFKRKDKTKNNKDNDLSM